MKFYQCFDQYLLLELYNSIHLIVKVRKNDFGLSGRRVIYFWM